ncbi:hypothetical protein Syun_021700 [Stephania yunnanensis]|uniref:Uncharacterized protein n=1 Tax=Stephania yunnanensis TaxID=152371 RepID=A0AAP0IH37_9MAGN
MNVPAVDGGLLKPDVVEGTDDEVPYFMEIKRTIPKGSVQSKDFKKQRKSLLVECLQLSLKASRRVRELLLQARESGGISYNTTPGLGGRLGGYGGYSGGGELGGGYGGFGGSGLGAYRGNAIRFESILCKTSVDSTAYIASLITILTELSEALMSSPDENGDFVKIESSLSLKGKNAAMVLCWLLGNGCLFAWNGAVGTDTDCLSVGTVADCLNEIKRTLTGSTPRSRFVNLCQGAPCSCQGATLLVPRHDLACVKESTEVSPYSCPRNVPRFDLARAKVRPNSCLGNLPKSSVSCAKECAKACPCLCQGSCQGVLASVPRRACICAKVHMFLRQGAVPRRAAFVPRSTCSCAKEPCQGPHVPAPRRRAKVCPCSWQGLYQYAVVLPLDFAPRRDLARAKVHAKARDLTHARTRRFIRTTYNFPCAYASFRVRYATNPQGTPSRN